MKWFLGLIGIGYGPVDDFAKGPAYLTIRLRKLGGVSISLRHRWIWWKNRTIRGHGQVGRL